MLKTKYFAYGSVISLILSLGLLGGGLYGVISPRGQEYTGIDTYRFSFSNIDGRQNIILNRNDPQFLELYNKGYHPDLISKLGDSYCLYPVNLSYNQILEWNGKNQTFRITPSEQILFVYDNHYVRECRISSEPEWSIGLIVLGITFGMISIVVCCTILCIRKYQN